MTQGISPEVWGRLTDSAKEALIDMAQIFARREDATVQIVTRAGGCRDFQVTIPAATLNRIRGT